MIVNPNVELLFIDFDPQYMKIVKEKLEKNKRLPGEIIHLVHDIVDGTQILKARDTIEMIALHTKADKVAVHKDLTKLRQVSLAEIMIIALFEDEDDISDLYRYGMNILVPPIYKPEMAVAYFESFIDRHRLLPGISSMKEVEHIKDTAKMQCGDLAIDPARFTVERDGLQIELTTLEFEVLHFLALNEGIVLSPERIYEQVWQERYTNNSSVTNCIHGLRSKIEPDPANPIYIITKYGTGYKFVSK